MNRDREKFKTLKGKDPWINSKFKDHRDDLVDKVKKKGLKNKFQGLRGTNVQSCKDVAQGVMHDVLMDFAMDSDEIKQEEINTSVTTRA